MVGPWIAAWVVGCGARSAHPVEPVPAAPVSERATEGSVTLVGTLVHEPYDPAVRSVEAYLGVEWFLVTAEGAREPLLPSDAVPDAALAALVGRRVAATGVRDPGHDPEPFAQAPTGPDGGPLKQRAGLRLSAIAER